MKRGGEGIGGPPAPAESRPQGEPSRTWGKRRALPQRVHLVWAQLLPSPRSPTRPPAHPPTCTPAHLHTRPPARPPACRRRRSTTTPRRCCLSRLACWVPPACWVRAAPPCPRSRSASRRARRRLCCLAPFGSPCSSQRARSWSCEVPGPAPARGPRGRGGGGVCSAPAAPSPSSLPAAQRSACLVLMRAPQAASVAVALGPAPGRKLGMPVDAFNQWPPGCGPQADCT
jgi:hypothetical protein